MRTYAELGHVHRCDPCVEYPGTWFVYVNGDEYPFTSKDDAMQAAFDYVERAAADARISVCWSCSDGDPRIGQVWFTGFYQLGRFNSWGQWVS